MSEKFDIVFGFANMSVKKEFKSFFRKFSSLTEAIEALLSLDDHLCNKYKFMENDVQYKLRARASSWDDTEKLNEVLLRWYKYVDSTNYKSMGCVIEELLMTRKVLLKMSAEEKETNAESKQEKDCIDDTSPKMDKLGNFILNSNNINQKVTSVEPKSSTNENLCTVDSNKLFSEFYAEGSQEKVCAQENSSKIDNTEKILLKSNTYDQNLSSVKIFPSTTEKCTTKMNDAKLLKAKQLAVNKTNITNDKEIPEKLTE